MFCANTSPAGRKRKAESQADHDIEQNLLESMLEGFETGVPGAKGVTHAGHA